MSTVFQPTDHHPDGPSKWPAFFECADFESEPDVDLEDVDEEAEDNSARGRGRAKHLAVAHLLAGDLTQRQRALNGLSDREADEVRWVVEKAIQIIESNGYSAADLKVEQRVTYMKPESFDPLYFGTGDGECGPLDFDWKFGFERNYFPQLVGCALPKMEQWGEQRRFGYIVYGRLRRVERYVLDRRTVETVAFGLLARRNSAHRKPTPCSYCGMCAKKLTCPAFVATPAALVERREDWALKLPTPHVSQLHDPAWLGAARYIWKRYLEPWGKAVEFGSSGLAHNGITPVGFNKRPEKGRVSISDARRAFQALEELLGADALWGAMSTTMTALVEAYQATAGVSEAKARAIIEAKLAEAKVLSFGEPTFKLIADKNAEELIRAAIGNPSLQPAASLPEKSSDRAQSEDYRD